MVQDVPARIWNKSLLSHWLYRSKSIVCSLLTKVVPAKKDVLRGHLQCLLYSVSQILFFSKSIEVTILCSFYGHTPAIFKLLLAVQSRQQMAQHKIATDNLLCGCSDLQSSDLYAAPTTLLCILRLSQGDVRDCDTICLNYFLSSSYYVEEVQKFIYTCMN